MPKDDYGASHWSSKKVWDRRKKNGAMKVNRNDPVFWYTTVGVQCDILTLMAVHGNLCLALRHPGNKNESRELVVSFVNQIGAYLVSLGALTQDELKAAMKLEAVEGLKN